MYLFYIIALIPALVGAILFACNKRVNWQEWLGGTAMAFAVSGIIHLSAYLGMTDDIETWSGRITSTHHYPQWVEEYRQRHSETYYTGTGKNRTAHTRVWYTTEHATHSEYWSIDVNYGEYEEDFNVDQAYYMDIVKNFGNVIEAGPKQRCTHGGHFDGGDNSSDLVRNHTGFIYPYTTLKHFENRIKAAPTVFSFAKVPTNMPVFAWPKNGNNQISDRLLGTAGRYINITEFDRMNSRLGPDKFVNVVMVGFDSADSGLGHWQEAKWIGGKKNDVVLTFGTDGTNVTWAYVFGWTEKEICKRNLETILLTNPLNNSILSVIEQEIRKGYVIKDWTKFDYISIEPPMWSYIVLIVIMVITQAGFWIWANMNEMDKETPRSNRIW